MEIETFTILPDSRVSGKSIKDLNFRSKTGATILAVERNNEMHAIIDPEFTFETGDIVFVTGGKDDIKRAVTYLAESAL